MSKKVEGFSMQILGWSDVDGTHGWVYPGIYQLYNVNISPLFDTIVSYYLSQ